MIHPADARPSASRTIALTICGLLAVQFLLGMYVNLYVNLPSVTTTVGGGFVGPMMGRFAEMFSPGLPVLMAHMMLGMILIVTGVIALIVAMSSQDHFAIGWSATGLAALIASAYGGITFFMFGHSNLASYLMAVGFLVCFASYLVIAVRSSLSASFPLKTHQTREID